MARHAQLQIPTPVVLVIGHFPESGHGFAVGGWQKISEIYEGNYWQKSETESVPSHGERQAEAVSGSEPLLRPIRLDDEGDAGNPKFKRRLYETFRTRNVWGVISCCTAENSSKLLDVLEPIDDQLHILGAGSWADEDRIFGLDDDHVL